MSIVIGSFIPQRINNWVSFRLQVEKWQKLWYNISPYDGQSVTLLKIWNIKNARYEQHKILLILWKAIVPYSAHRSPSIVPIPSRINPVHAFQSYAFKIRFNVIFQSMPMFSSDIFLHETSACINTPKLHMPLNC